MEAVILDNIPFQLDLAPLMKRLHVRTGSTYADDFRRLARDAQAIARPKALYKVAFVESRGDDTVVVDGTTLTSRVLRVNLEWSRPPDDMLRQYWADTLMEMALRAAIRALNEHLVERYRTGRTSAMSPGSLGDWPLQEQRALFAILGNPEDAIGVRLSDGFLMIPIKSVSGIRFPTEESFESCQLCPRENCPGRRAPYDEGLYERKYRPRTD